MFVKVIWHGCDNLRGAVAISQKTPLKFYRYNINIILVFKTAISQRSVDCLGVPVDRLLVTCDPIHRFSSVSQTSMQFHSILGKAHTAMGNHPVSRTDGV